MRANWLRYLAYAAAAIAAGFIEMVAVALTKLYTAGYEINWLAARKTACRRRGRMAAYRLQLKSANKA